MVKRVLLAVAVTVTAGFGVSALPAHAASTCSSIFQKKVINNAPDEYRAGARCTSLDANRKFRAKLVRTNPLVDITTSYYTDENVWHYTGYNIGGSSATLELATVS